MAIGSEMNVQKKKLVLKESTQSVDFETLRKMIFGEVDAPDVYVVRQVLASEHCDEIENCFTQIIESLRGGSRTNDFVKVEQVGATQFTKNMMEYLQQCESTRDHIQSLIDSISAPTVRDNFLYESSLRSFCADRDISFRPASHLDLKVNSFTMRRWTNSGVLLLMPHEDLSQLRTVEKEGFEIANVKVVIANNLCVKNDQGGELLIWNKIPTEAEKIALGLERSGYPYPIEFVDDIEKITVNIQAGDMYYFNANLLHGVNPVTNNDRLTLGRFIGKVDDKTITYWT